MQHPLSSRIDYRREKLYRDRGSRQIVTPFGLTRAAMATYQPDPTTEDESSDALFFPETIEQPEQESDDDPDDVEDVKAEMDFEWLKRVWDGDQQVYKTYVFL